MFLRVVKGSFARKRQRKLIAVVAIALGASVTTAMLAVALGVGDKVNRELRSYGANIEALPRQRPLNLTANGVQLEATGAKGYIRQQDLSKIKSVFWAHNILSFAPFLIANATATANGTDQVQTTMVGTWFDHEMATESGTSLVTGVRIISPWWQVTGSWPQDGECLLGAVLSENIHAHAGDRITINCNGRTESLRVSGILTTGAAEDEQLITGLDFVQQITGLEDRIDRLEVSALTNPEDELAKKDPQTLSAEEYERWSCTPYPSSIARDLETVLEGAEARPILRISQTEGALLSRIVMMMLLVTIAALAASVLGVSSTMMSSVLERKTEIGLFKAIGASNVNVFVLFLSEAAILGILGGAAGLATGYGLAQLISRSVFNSQLEVTGVLAPIVLLIAVCVAFAGSAIPLRSALKFDPSLVLRGR